jgi:hypothetical protein
MKDRRGVGGQEGWWIMGKKEGERDEGDRRKRIMGK